MNARINYIVTMYHAGEYSYEVSLYMLEAIVSGVEASKLLK